MLNMNQLIIDIYFFMIFQNPICSRMKFFDVWKMINHMFTVIFNSSELKV
jgi:hypothetical protein